MIKKGKNCRISDKASLKDENGKGAIIIGDECSLNEFCFLGVGDGGNLVMGSYVRIGAGTCISTLIYNHDRTDIPMYAQGVTNKDVTIEEDVWIGMNATILPGVKIGKGAIIGAGSVVTKDVEPYSVMAGNPAKLLRKRK